MKVLVEEDLASRTLLDLLATQSGLEMLPPHLQSSDDEVWARAQAEGAIVLTGNARDFVPLARADTDHAGLLLVVRKGEPGDLTSLDIANAIGEVAAAYPEGIAGVTLVVNSFAQR